VTELAGEVGEYAIIAAVASACSSRVRAALAEDAEPFHRNVIRVVTPQSSRTSRM
jgi:hypothetical protein